MPFVKRTTVEFDQKSNLTLQPSDVNRAPVICVKGERFVFDDCFEDTTNKTVVSDEKLTEKLRKIAVLVGKKTKEEQDLYIKFLKRELIGSQRPIFFNNQRLNLAIPAEHQPVAITEHFTITIEDDGSIVHEQPYVMRDLTSPPPDYLDGTTAAGAIKNPRAPKNQQVLADRLEAVNVRERIKIKPPAGPQCQCEVVQEIEFTRFEPSKLKDAQQKLTGDGFLSSQEILSCYFSNPADAKNIQDFQCYLQVVAEMTSGDVNELRRRFHADMSGFSPSDSQLAVAITELNKFRDTKEEWCIAHSMGETVFRSGEVVVGMYEDQGRRREQEDVSVAFVVPMFKLLTDAGREKALRATIDVMHTQERQRQANLVAPWKGWEEGSTVCGTIAYRQDSKVIASTASLGDSKSFLVIVQGGRATAVKLLNRLQKPKLKYIGGRYGYAERLNTTGLAVAGAVGDFQSERDPEFTRTPFIDHHEEKIPSGAKAFIVNTCDGVTELDCLKEEAIGKLVAAYSDRLPQEIAEKIGGAAYHRGSGDNLSVQVFAVTEKPTGTFVFDGHGGNETSTALGQNFFPVLRARIPSIGPRIPEDIFKDVVASRYASVSKHISAGEQITMTADALTARARELFVKSKNPVVEMKEHQDKLRAHIVEEVLNLAQGDEGLVKSIRAMERWIKVMDACVEQKDYYTAYAIYETLENSDLRHLTAARAGLSPTVKKYLQEFREMVGYLRDDKDNYVNGFIAGRGSYWIPPVSLIARLQPPVQSFTADDKEEKASPNKPASLLAQMQQQQKLLNSPALLDDAILVQINKKTPAVVVSQVACVEQANSYHQTFSQRWNYYYHKDEKRSFFGEVGAFVTAALEWVFGSRADKKQFVTQAVVLPEPAASAAPFTVATTKALAAAAPTTVVVPQPRTSRRTLTVSTGAGAGVSPGVSPAASTASLATSSAETSPGSGSPASGSPVPTVVARPAVPSHSAPMAALPAVLVSQPPSPLRFAPV